MQGFRGLKGYEKSYKLSLEMYRFANTMPREERYGLISQIKRAATSIPLNIAEGYAKKASNAEYRRFLLMAIGSVNEMEVLLDMCKDLGYMKEEEHESYILRYEEVGKIIGGLIKSVT